MAFRLVSTLGVWDLGLGETLIGRSRACAICFLDGRLSRRHASLRVAANEAYIVDLTSTNGVLVNGRRITGPARLNDGDQIIIGPCLFTVETDSKPAQASTTSRRADPHAQPSTALIDTEAIERKSGADSPPRHIASAIAAAVSSDARPASPASTPPSGSPSDRFSPQDFRPTETSAVSVRATPNPDSSTITPDDQAKEPTDPLIEAHELADTVPEQPAPPNMPGIASDAAVLPRHRMLAACCDAAQTSLIALLVAVPIALIGAGLALQHAGLSVVNGLPAFAFDQPRASVLDLAWSVASWDGLGRIWSLLPELQRQDPTAIAILILAGILTALVFAAVHVLATVVATILAGGPMWHRHFGLAIIDAQSRIPPSWGKAALRWSLLLILWPLAIRACWRGEVGLHDRLSGCRVVRSPVLR